MNNAEDLNRRDAEYTAFFQHLLSALCNSAVIIAWLATCVK
jgi:hypothetical protein